VFLQRIECAVHPNRREHVQLRLPGVKIEGCVGTVEGFIKGVEKAVKAMVEAAVMAELEAEAEAVLGRRSHARRDKGDRREVQACCLRWGRGGDKHWSGTGIGGGR
jgi:copper chaperone CopZ